jgi:hypothetical protein
MFHHSLVSVVSILSLVDNVLSAPSSCGNASTQWTNCPSSFEISPRLQCANITVPLDHDQPYGEKIDLTLVKLPASNTENRKGTIVIQFGGPGDPTYTELNTTAYTETVFSEIAEDFDILVAEPRGIAYNHPVKCDVKLLQYLPPTKFFPTTEQEYYDSVEYFGALGRDCLERTGKIMEYMDTLTTAKDLEYVRLAIGEGGLNYCKPSFTIL